MCAPTALLPGLVTKSRDGKHPQHLVLSLPGMSSDLQRGGQKQALKRQQTPSEADIVTHVHVQVHFLVSLLPGPSLG